MTIYAYIYIPSDLVSLLQNVADPSPHVAKIISVLYPVDIVAYCMYGHHIHSKSMDQPGKVVNPARGQLNSENEYFPVPVRA